MTQTRIFRGLFILPMVEEKRVGFKKKTISLAILVCAWPQPNSKREIRKKIDIARIEGDNIRLKNIVTG